MLLGNYFLAATAGLTVVGALLADQAGAHGGEPGSQAVLAYVHDPRSGDISVLSGDREVRIRDRKLAAAIAGVANTNGR